MDLKDSKIDVDDVVDPAKVSSEKGKDGLAVLPEADWTKEEETRAKRK